MPVDSPEPSGSQHQFVKTVTPTSLESHNEDTDRKEVTARTLGSTESEDEAESLYNDDTIKNTDAAMSQVPDGFTLDDNLNLVVKSSELSICNKNCPESNLDYLLKPDPVRGFSAFRKQKLMVFNVFNDLGKWLRKNILPEPVPPKRGVHFPEEIIAASELKGEIAGKHRYVPHIKTEFRRPKAWASAKAKIIRARASSSNSKTSETDAFVPKLSTVPDVGKLEIFCERFDCTEKIITELGHIHEGSMFNYQLAAKFLFDHRVKTLKLALEAVDIQFPQLPGVTQQGQDHHQESIELNESTANDGVIILQEVSSSRLGLMSTSIWIFGYCIPFLFTTDAKPNKLLFQELMEQFSVLALEVEESTDTLIRQSVDFQNFVAEIKRVLKVLQDFLDFPGDTYYKKLKLRRGGGLQFKNKSQCKNINRSDIPKMVTVMLNKINNPEGPTNFEESTLHEKMSSLKHLLSFSSSKHSDAKTQVNLLVDDIVGTFRDPSEDSDFSSLLENIYIRTSIITGQSDSEKKVLFMDTMAKCLKTMTDDFADFERVANHVILKLMELRDMIQLTYEYIKDVIGRDTMRLLVQDKFFSRQKIKNPGYKPNYSALNYVRPYYEDCYGLSIPAETYCFQIRESSDKNIQGCRKPVIEFSEGDLNDDARGSVISNSGSASSVRSSNEEPPPLEIVSILKTTSAYPDTVDEEEKEIKEIVHIVSTSNLLVVEISSLDKTVKPTEPPSEDEPAGNQ